MQCRGQDSAQTRMEGEGGGQQFKNIPFHTKNIDTMPHNFLCEDLFFFCFSNFTIDEDLLLYKC